jgi:hypothetical protein
LDGIDGGSIDGFVYLDGYALTALLQITGPLTIEGVDGPINARNANDFFFDEQYRLTNRDELKTEQSEIFAELFASLVDRELPGPERLGAILGPVSRQGRLQVATFDDDENAFLQSVKLQREFGWSAETGTETGAETATVDGFGLVQANGSASKLDLYLHRDVTYDVAIDDAGQLSATLTVELTSAIPDDAPEYALGSDAPGVNLVFLSVYTPHGLTSLALDGEPAQPAVSREFGYSRFEATVELPPNTTRVVEFELTGPVDPTRPYDVAIWHQPLVHNDTVQLTYRRGTDAPIEQELELVEDVVVSFGD